MMVCDGVIPSEGRGYVLEDYCEKLPATKLLGMKYVSCEIAEVVIRESADAYPG